jgi:hypothetical protein
MTKAGEGLRTPEQYRARAMHVRLIAATLTDSAAAAREALLEVADEYERMAEALEAQGGGSTGKT